MSDGEHQLTDFNGAMFPSWNTKKNKYCKGDYDAKEKETRDIVQLGKLFNFMLKGKWPHDDPKTIKSPRHSTHLFDLYVRKAMKMCLRAKEQNVTAQQVANMLHQVYTNNTKFERVTSNTNHIRPKQKVEPPV